MRLKLKHITFTGIDVKTDIQDLIDIQREFPIAEFGVLTSYHWYENGNRYLNPAFLSNLYAGNGELNLALHICGSAAHDAAVGEWYKIYDHLFGALDIFKHIGHIFFSLFLVFIGEFELGKLCNVLYHII